MKVVSFKEFLEEEEHSKAIVQTGINSKGIDNQTTKDIINSRLSMATNHEFLTPYMALGSIARVLAYANIIVPQYNFLDRKEGEVVFDANQFGRLSGVNSDGSQAKPDSEYFVYFSYAENDDGYYDCFAALVDSEELERILDIEGEKEEDIDRIGTEQQVKEESEQINEWGAALGILTRVGPPAMAAGKELVKKALPAAEAGISAGKELAKKGLELLKPSAPKPPVGAGPSAAPKPPAGASPPAGAGPSAAPKPPAGAGRDAGKAAGIEGAVEAGKAILPRILGRGKSGPKPPSRPRGKDNKPGKRDIDTGSGSNILPNIIGAAGSMLRNIDVPDDRDYRGQPASRNPAVMTFKQRQNSLSLKKEETLDEKSVIERLGKIKAPHTGKSDYRPSEFYKGKHHLKNPNRNLKSPRIRKEEYIEEKKTVKSTKKDDDENDKKLGPKTSMLTKLGNMPKSPSPQSKDYRPQNVLAKGRDQLTQQQKALRTPSNPNRPSDDYYNRLATISLANPFITGSRKGS